MRSNIKPDCDFSNYTELSKYYELSLDNFKSIFEARYLDWGYYLKNAEKTSIEIGYPIKTTDVLTEDLIDYDRDIKKFYKTCKLLLMSNTKIYKEFSKKDNEYLKFK